jgi:malonate decarboxylase epsilon subunit
MSTAFLFPGQGSQSSGMLHRLPAHQAVDLTLTEASEVLQRDVFELDTPAALSSTVAVQLALLISGVAMARVLMQEGGVPDYVAGHSVGVFGAAVASSVMSFYDALHLVKLRASLMERLFPTGYGMGVIVGLDPWKVQQITEEFVSKGEEIFVANLNAAQQVAIAGKREGVVQALHAAHKLGARKAELLQVPVPSHCTLLEPVAKQVLDMMNLISMTDPQIPYAANTTARILHTAESIRNDIAQSIASPVLWHDATTILYERGTRLFVEMCPGHVLTDLACKAFPSARSVAAHGMRLDSLLYLMKRELNL